MTTYKELLAQRAELEKQIQEARQNELTTALAQVRSLIAEFDLTAEDIFSTKAAPRKNAGTKVAPKYKNPETGETWTGRGKAPKWIDGKDKAQFLIAQ